MRREGSVARASLILVHDGDDHLLGLVTRVREDIDTWLCESEDKGLSV